MKPDAGHGYRVFKKWTICTLSVVLSLCCAAYPCMEGTFQNIVAADVIFEPPSTFYEEHRKECQLEERTYTVLTKTPYYRRPDGSPVGEVEAGTQIQSVATYSGNAGASTASELQDEKWICFSYLESYGEYWIRWSACEVKYDNISFLQEHSDEITTRRAIIRSGDTVIFFTYPQSGEIAGTSVSGEDVYVDWEYTDPMGRKWGYVSYHYATKNVWVCMDDPGLGYEEIFGVSPDLSKIRVEYQDEMNRQAEEEQERIKAVEEEMLERERLEKSKNRDIMAAIIFPILAVIIVTIVLLEIFRKRQRKGL